MTIHYRAGAIALGIIACCSAVAVCIAPARAGEKPVKETPVVEHKAATYQASQTSTGTPVTIIFALEPLKSNGTRWDAGRGADIILCLKKACYRSRGQSRDAERLSVRRTMGPLTALNIGRKAGACTNALACAFRNVVLPEAVTQIQPIDIDVVRHDRLAIRTISADTTCHTTGRRLVCDGGVHAPEYSLWIVPEETAERAGAAAIDFAVFDGLRSGRRTYLERVLERERIALSERARSLLALITGERTTASCATRAEFLEGAFRLAGLGGHPGSADEKTLMNFLSAVTPGEAAQTVAGDDDQFWRLHDRLEQFTNMSMADKLIVRASDDPISLNNVGSLRVLAINHVTRTRADALVDRCADEHERQVSGLINSVERSDTTPAMQSDRTADDATFEEDAPRQTPEQFFGRESTE